MARRAGLSRERVLRAAVALADERGIDALSMRNLAKELGVEAMSLYNHVSSKDDLLDGIVELVASDIDLALGDGDWRAAMRRRAISAHDVLSSHPWAANLWMASKTFGVSRMRFADAMLAGLRQAGFADGLTYHGYHVLQSYVLGVTLFEGTLDFDAGELEELATAFLREFPADDYPDLAEHIRQHMVPREDEKGSFELGLDLILDGLERLGDARGI